MYTHQSYTSLKLQKYQPTNHYSHNKIILQHKDNKTSKGSKIIALVAQAQVSLTSSTQYSTAIHNPAQGYSTCKGFNKRINAKGENASK
jgi:hypothetical protein